MYRLFLSFSFVLLFSICACKKDKLHFSNVTKIESFSDTSRLNKILFFNDTIGFVVGGKRFADATILTTHDGGFNWVAGHYPISGKGIYDITQSPTGGIYTVGYDGKLLFSLDTGRNWRFAQMDYFSFTGIAFTNDNNALVVGGISFNEGQILNIDSIGTVTRRLKFSYQLNAIKMVTPQVGYICCFGGLLKTTDGGETWFLQEVSGDNFTSIDAHGDELWMCGASGSIYHTGNGGDKWECFRDGRNFTLPKYRLYGIFFKDAKNGWVVGEDGKMLKSDDGGKHWMEYDSFTTQTLRAVALCPNGELLVSGDNGVMYRVDQ